jgi:hypothetical protein
VIGGLSIQGLFNQEPHMQMPASVAVASLTLLFAAGPSPSVRQDPVQTRGAQAMGFDQDKTIHHFRVYEDGGAIEVLVKDAADAANRDAIRSHLPHIAMMFGSGDFDMPHFIHATDVPGSADMARLRERIRYTYVEMPQGGRVDVVTTDPEALRAVHAFLRFQISDHKTGDDVAARRRPGGGTAR